MLKITEIDKDLGCYKISAETNGYLISRNGQSILIDCPEGDIEAELEELGLPIPSIIFHTQIQAEHCNEWQYFPDALIYVPAGTTDLATKSSTFFKDSNTVWDSSRKWSKSAAEEKYGIAGCITVRPTEEPLMVEDELSDGEEMDWEDLTFEIIALPGSDKNAIGLYLREQKCLFSGDLIYAGGLLTNLYDIERNYGLPLGYKQLNNSLEIISKLDIEHLLPSTGPVVSDIKESITNLQDRIGWVLNPPKIKEDEKKSERNIEPLRSFGHFNEVTKGVFQNNNFGNMIVFIDSAGRGLVIDPDPCISWEEDESIIAEELKSLEENAGLKTVELILITHYHGDHIQFCDYLIKNYDCSILTTQDVADIMMDPEDYNLPCTVDWYNMPVDRVIVDEILTYEHQFNWNDIEITPIHTPGHCNAHVGFLVQWEDEKIAITGDTIKYGKGPIVAKLPIIYNDTAWPDKGLLVTLKRLKKFQPTLILGGHSHTCRDNDGLIINDMTRISQQALGLVAEMVAGNNMKKAMTPPPEQNN